MKVSQVDIDAIHIGKRLRAVQWDVVEKIAESVAEIGLRVPITVRTVDGSSTLISGLHRIEAHRKLNRQTIAAVEFKNEAQALLWEVDENLKRAELTSRERKAHVAERLLLLRESKEMAAKKTKAISAPMGQKQPRQHRATGNSPGRPKGGKSEEARELGVSRQTIDRAEKIANLSDEAKAEARRLGLHNTTRVLESAAFGVTPALQVAELQAEHARRQRKAQQKLDAERLKQAGAVEQSNASVPASKPVQVIDHSRIAAREFFFWLIEEVGDKAIEIMSRLRDLDIPVLLSEVERCQRDGEMPAPTASRVH